MNWDQVEEKWKPLAGKAEEQRRKLTDDELEVAERWRDRSAGKVHKKAGRVNRQTLRKVKEWGREV
jgi:uncharacterized protein YjbJ (UPF0337 family)